jgi:aspartate/tyrosine/aromatic aminotransferase
MNLIKKNTVPLSIPESIKKKEFLEKEKIPFIYLGQGLIFTPPKSADKDFGDFLKYSKIKQEEYSLDILRKGRNKESSVYCSARLDDLWKNFEEKKFVNKENEGFGNFLHDISKTLISDLFSLEKSNIETFQCDSLMMALETVFLAIEKTHGKVNYLILPSKYQYSGYNDFFAKLKSLGTVCEIIFIPEIKNDGTQDLEKIEKIFEEVKSKGYLALFIDQEHNNNASGYDRNSELNDKLYSIISTYSENIIYFGDIAYKGLKEKLFFPYEFVKKLEKEKIYSYFYISFSKLTNYRFRPNFKNILFALQSDKFPSHKINNVFSTISRSMGIGTSKKNSEFIYSLIHDSEFIKEVEILRLYLSYIKFSLQKSFRNTNLEKYFSKKNSGIFRCLPKDIITKLNSGNLQVVTVGERINIWSLGCPNLRKIFVDVCLS